MKTLAVIPARGGSKGIPRKNLRPVAGNPLIYYSIRACLAAGKIDQVVVSTDDEEIALFAQRFGAEVLWRPEHLAEDVTTLDPVIVHAAKAIEEQSSVMFGIVITVQPTSPLIAATDIDTAVNELLSDEFDTVLSVREDTHLRWRLEHGNPRPEYVERVNRQQLPRTYRETGAIIACSRAQLEKGTRIGARVQLLELPPDRSVDIDSFSDLALCEYLLTRKRVVFAVVGHASVGLGHVYRALSLAHDLVECELRFVCEEQSDLVPLMVGSNNYAVHVCPDGGLAEACLSLEPDLVVNDILDTDRNYISKLKQAGLQVINFEDLGPGSQLADLVINALYPHQVSHANTLVGPEYFCLRDEFLYLPPRTGRDSVEKVLVSFGGVDEGNLTMRCLEALSAYCLENSIVIDVVTGPGYLHRKELDSYMGQMRPTNINWFDNTRRISDYMLAADVAITSGGRTVLELVSMAVPTLVICQNAREMTHTYISENNGIVNLGHRADVCNDDILGGLIKIATDRNYRKSMVERMQGIDLKAGKKRVIKLIRDILFAGNI